MSQAIEIMEDLVTTIRAIDDSTLGVKMRDIQVTFGDKHPDTINFDQFPHFSVVLLDQPGEREPSFEKIVMNVQIVGTFRRDKDAPYEKWLEAIKYAVTRDVSRGRRAIETFVSNIARETLLNESRQIYVMDLRIPFTVAFGDT